MTTEQATQTLWELVAKETRVRVRAFERGSAYRVSDDAVASPTYIQRTVVIYVGSRIQSPVDFGRVYREKKMNVHERKGERGKIIVLSALTDFGLEIITTEGFDSAVAEACRAYRNWKNG